MALLYFSQRFSFRVRHSGAFWVVVPQERGPPPRAPLVSLFRGRVGQGLFLLLLRHLAAVAHGDSVLIVVFSYHESVFELDVDGARFEQDSLL